MKLRIAILSFCAALIFLGCKEEVKTESKPTQNTSSAELDKVTPELHYSLVSVLPHDSSAFTEGLLFNDGKLYESTGAPNNIAGTRSTVGIVDLKTGKLDVKIEIDRNTYFGEGIQILNGKIFQLTYQNQICFVYNLKNFKQVAQFNYPNKEGWGLTTDGKELIMSDGSSQLTYIDVDSYQITKKQIVSEQGYEVFNLNELEYVDGYIYANVWMTNRIVKIDASTGNVIAAADLTALVEQARKRNANISEMNGIAYNPQNKHFYITGKMWSSMYELQFAN